MKKKTEKKGKPAEKSGAQGSAKPDVKKSGKK